MKSLKEIVEATRGHNLQSASLNQPQISGLAAGDLPSSQAAGSLAEIVFVSLPRAECGTQAETVADVVPVAACSATSSTTVSPYEIDVQLPRDYDLAMDDSIQQLEKQGPAKLEVLQDSPVESHSSHMEPSESASIAEPTQATEPTPTPLQTGTQESQEEITDCSAEHHSAEHRVADSQGTDSQGIDSQIAEFRQLDQNAASQSDAKANENPPLQSGDGSRPTSVQEATADSVAVSREPAVEKKEHASISWVRPKSIAVEQIAQRLTESISIQHAASVLLVTSGSNQRFRTAAQDLALALTAQLHRPGVYTQISISDQGKVLQPQSVDDQATLCYADWQSFATDYRFQQNGQLSVIEVILDRQTLKKTPQSFSAVFQKQTQSHEFSLWMVDHNDEELVQYLTGACDATLVLVDLGHSSVSDCRLAVTQLREHGSRLLGTVVLSETKGRSSWVKS